MHNMINDIEFIRRSHYDDIRCFDTGWNDDYTVIDFSYSLDATKWIPAGCCAANMYGQQLIQRGSHCYIDHNGIHRS